MRGTELSKSNHEHTHTQTYYPLHTRKKTSCTLCPVLHWRTHLSSVLKWVRRRTLDGRFATAPQCRVTEHTHTHSPLREKINTCTQKTHNKNNKGVKEHTCEHYWLKKALFRTVYYLSKEKKKKKQSTSQQEAVAPMLNIDSGFIYCIVAWLEAADVAT